MEAELVTVGTELLLGFTLDSNSTEIATALAEIGVRVTRRTTVADEADQIGDAVGAALQRTGFVIVTGGLGPTRDDVTKRAVAALLDVPLELDEAYLRILEARFAEHFRRGPMPPSNRSQAEVPRGATVLPNQHGTAPGLWVEDPRGAVVLLPGVPHEMRALMQAEVVPRLLARDAASGGMGVITSSVTLRTAGITESGLATRLNAIEEAIEGVTLAYLPGFEGVDLRVTAWSVPADRAERTLTRAVERLRDALGSRCYGLEPTDLAGVVLDQLRARAATLAVAESCTGGLIGARVTAIPGSSDVFVGGVVCYSDASKVRDLDVPEALLAHHGAVSEQVVRAMAKGVARRFDADAAIAVTGIAGPTGGTAEKPAGTVWLAARMGSEVRARRSRLPGPRGEVRARAAQAGLNLLRRLLLEGDAREAG
ncbi:MAG: competence/damage-inducible protein A [Gemmatimonadales bacterium]|jgi:nicotinamide-nucleotide amidase